MINLRYPKPDIEDKPEIKDQYQDRSAHVGHTLILGAPRVGKTRVTRVMELLITQDIHRGE